MTTEPEAYIRIRNVHCETSLDLIDDFARIKYGTSVPKELKAPLIRMFGEKCLANIYGFLPFFYIRTRTPFSSELKKLIGKMIVKCAKNLDTVLIPGYPLLADVVPFQFTDIYGFHPHKDHFIKVIFYDQILCHRIGLTLQKDCGKNDLLQPYYAHIPYLLQFFMAYDIVGMGSVRFRQKGVRFRRISDNLLPILPNALKNYTKPNSHMINEFDVFCDDIILEKTPSMKSEYQISGLESIWKEEEMRYRLRNQELPRPERPECGIPEIRTEREDHSLEILRNMCNEFLTGDPNMSQIISDQRNKFSQTQAIIDNVDKAELSMYVDKAIENEKEEERLNENEARGQNDGGEEEEEEETVIHKQMLEMTQIRAVDETIIIEDNSEDEMEKIITKFQKLEANYPPVLLEPNQEEVETPPFDFANPESNETWCADEELFPATPYKYENIRPPSPPPKISKEQKDGTEKFKNACAVKNLTVLSIEALFQCNQESVKEKSDKASEKKYIPNPQTDPCLGIFYVIYNDICNDFEHADIIGGCVIDKMRYRKKDFPIIECVRSEDDIFRWLALILKKYDPDIIVGYDIRRLSFNYLVQRAAYLGIQSFNEAVSRLSPKWENDIRKTIDDIRGRIFLNVWRIVRREQPMRHYRMSAVVHEILDQRFADMSQFYIEKLLVDNDYILK
uniref:DNA-directed DNA polymerase family B exonuclease domain-containing protein n=1 Tax=Panagrolaimus superbus TaxID=310955 RepID=A0A914XZM0_9BILA